MLVSRPSRTFILFLLVVGGLIVFLWVGQSAIVASGQALKQVRLVWLVPALSAALLSMSALAGQQHRLILSTGVRLPKAAMLSTAFVGNAINGTVPMAGPGLSVAYAYRRFVAHGLDSAVVAWLLVVSGISSTAAFAVIVFYGTLVSNNAGVEAAGMGLGILSLLLGVAVSVALRTRTTRQALEHVAIPVVRIGLRLLRRADDAPSTVRAAIAGIDGVHFSGQDLRRVFGLSSVNWIADIGCLLFAFRAVGYAIPWQGLVLAWAAGMGAASLGFTPGGVGLAEAALSAALVGAGVPVAPALAVSLVYRAVSFWFIVGLGWLSFLWLRIRSNRYAAKPRSTAAVSGRTRPVPGSPRDRAGDVDGARLSGLAAARRPRRQGGVLQGSRRRRAGGLPPAPERAAAPVGPAARRAAGSEVVPVFVELEVAVPRLMPGRRLPAAGLSAVWRPSSILERD